MNHVTRNGVNMFGCTIEQFKEKLIKKPNILILSDEEMKRINKAIQIMDVFEQV